MIYTYTSIYNQKNSTEAMYGAHFSASDGPKPRL